MTNTSNNKKKKKRGVSIKACIVMLAVVMLLGCAIGSTVAWLTAKTDEVKNTFTYGDINIELFEHEYDPERNVLKTTDKATKPNEYKIVPGITLPKDPTVVVEKGSEKCWLFVKVEKIGSWADGVNYTLALDENNSGWTKGTGIDIPANVYYTEIDVSNADKNYTFDLIKDKKIIVSEELTKEKIAELKKTETYANPELKFTAYAVQKDGIDDVADAWAKVNP